MDNNLLKINDYYRILSNIIFDPAGVIIIRNEDNFSYVIDYSGKKISKDYDYISKYENGYAHVDKGIFQGFIDLTGKEVVPCKYKYASLEDNINFFKVQNHDGLYGFLNIDGNVFIKCQYKSARSFYENLCAVKNKEGKWGYIDNLGNTVIPFIYDDVKDFHEGLAGVYKEGLWSFIDHDGKEVINIEEGYEVGDFSDGLAPISENCELIKKKYGFIDRKGNLKIPYMYKRVASFINGVAPVEYCESKWYGPGWGLIDKNNKTIVHFDYNKGIEYIGNNLYVCKYSEYSDNELYKMIFNSKGECLAEIKDVDSFINDMNIYGMAPGYYDECKYLLFVDKNGELAFDLKNKYTKIYKFSEGLLRVKGRSKINGVPSLVGKLYGFVNSKGEEVIKPKFFEASDFHEGLCAVRKAVNDFDYTTFEGDKCGYINDLGEKVIPYLYNRAFDFSEGLACASKIISGFERFGFINKENKEIIKFKYLDGKCFNEGLCPVKTESGWGYIDKNDKFVIEPQFKQADIFIDGIAFVIDKNDNSYYIDKNCNYVFGLEYCCDIEYNDQKIHLFDGDKSSLQLKKIEILNRIRNEYTELTELATFSINGILNQTRKVKK